MSAGAMHVDRLHARYRVAADSAEHRQLDGLLRLVLDGALERALEGAGVDLAVGETCVRELRVPVRLALARHGDAALASAWADAIAAELAARISAGGRDVVRYGSRRQALVDVALGVAAGHLERAWAWRSLGLWPAPALPPAEALVVVLAREGEAVAPVLAAVAHAGRLEALAARIEPAGWRALAVAALCAAGVPETAARAAAAGAEPAGAPLRRALARSAIARAFASSAAPAPAAAVAALAIAEAEPALLPALGGRLPAAVAATARELRAARASEPVADEPPDEPSLPAPTRASTEWGGLAFALHAVVDLDLPARFEDHDLRAVLHALALVLVAAEPGDPAALAFAGLPPDADPPEPLRDAEPLVDVGEEVRAWLAARLRVDPGELDLAVLLRRRGEIVADPGWIEVHLRLDEVDVDVRRAGLDLDPGHLPFLGCVVRLVYA